MWNKKILQWARANSLWALHFCFGCCSTEISAAMAPRYDLERFGIKKVSSPRQADVLLINGPITIKTAQRIKVLWSQIPEPKYILAIGTCSLTGGPYFDSPNIINGAKELGLKPDVFVPGCPPQPEAIVNGFLELQKKVRKNLVNL